MGIASPARGASTPWVEGVHYFRLDPARVGPAPAGKATVTEVFSYGCPACNAFQPYWNKFRASLPAGTAVDYLPAAFVPAEDWPMFQRAYLAARTLGIAERTHEAMFAAVWKTGELGTMDPATRGLKRTMPTIEDAAKFYARVGGVPAERFLAAAHSFSMELDMKRADERIVALQADSTPTLVIDGRYRVSEESAGGFQQLVDVAHWLLAKDGH
jgi:thiol:disulfide interchange protein DsbA